MEQEKKHHFWDPLVSMFKRQGAPFGRESGEPRTISKHEQHTRESVGVDSASSERPFTEQEEPGKP